MSKDRRLPSSSREIENRRVLTTLKQTDRAVVKYLNKLARGSDTCTASIPRIAKACDISERQVQVSVGRLISSGLLRRVGYDFGNPDKAKRGTVFKVLKSTA